MAWTSAAQVIADWIGEDAPTDTAKVDLWIGKAERLLRSKLPDLQARVDANAEPDLSGNIADVVTEMVHEVFRNPEGIRQRQEGSGPFTGSVTFGGDKPGALRVTGEQLERLAGPTDSRGAFTIDMIPSTSRFSGTSTSVLNSWEVG